MMLCVGDTGDKDSHGAVGPAACPPPRLPSLRAPVAVGSRPARPPVPSQHAGGHLWPWDSVSPARRPPGVRLLPAPVPRQRRVPAGGIGCPQAPWPQHVPPSWGHRGQSDQVREGRGDTFSLSLAPRCHRRCPKIAGSSCLASSRQHCLRAGPPRLASLGGTGTGRRRMGVPPPWLGPAGHGSPGKDNLFLGQVPREPEPPLTPTRMALGGTKRAGAVPRPLTLLGVGVPNLHSPGPHTRSQAPPATPEP